LANQWEDAAWDPNVKQRASVYIGISDDALTKLAVIVGCAGEI